MAAPVTPDNMPTTASYVFATAILAGVIGYFAGQGASLGLFSSSPATTGRSTSKRATKENHETKEEDLDSEDEESEEEGDGTELATFEGNNDEVKLVLVVRTDLGMGKGKRFPVADILYSSFRWLTTLLITGKIAAQCSHATLACYKYYFSKAPNSPILKRWESGGQAKVALQVKTEEEMLVLQAQAISLGLCARVIQDAGRTQIASGSRTVLGVLGPKTVVDQVTGHLKLL
jgi:peptidyl-tRNA hydrolase